MKLKELLTNEDVRALVARGQEFGFLAIGELTQTLETADLDAPSATALAAEFDEMGIELLEDDEAERRVAELAEEAERPRKLNLKHETTTDSLQLFLKDVGRVPLLNARQEVELAKKIELGDLEAKRKMVEANLRLVVSIAKNYRNQGLGFLDLIRKARSGWSARPRSSTTARASSSRPTRPGGSVRPSPARSPTRAAPSACRCTLSRSSTRSTVPSASSCPSSVVSPRSPRSPR